MDIGKDLVCLFGLSVSEQEAGTLWDKPDEKQLEQRRCCLED